MTLLSPKHAGARLGLSVSRLSQLDNAGVLPAIRDSSGRRVFPAEVVEKFAAERAAAKGKDGSVRT
jgi:hypothetical protein